MGLAGHVQVLETSRLEASHPLIKSCAKVRRISAHHFAALLMLWDVIVLTPHFAAALLARDLDDAGVREDERAFEFTVTYKRDVVIAATRSLLSRECPLAD